MACRLVRVDLENSVVQETAVMVLREEDRW
jgi:hypothetical protein